jgi:hypothetical protein
VGWLGGSPAEHLLPARPGKGRELWRGQGLWLWVPTGPASELPMADVQQRAVLTRG